MKKQVAKDTKNSYSLVSKVSGFAIPIAFLYPKFLFITQKYCNNIISWLLRLCLCEYPGESYFQVTKKNPKNQTTEKGMTWRSRRISSRNYEENGTKRRKSIISEAIILLYQQVDKAAFTSIIFCNIRDEFHLMLLI